ncbi:MAG TPA: hypothetical protein VGP55_11725 [Chitinophagaceae bacterium]|nr:hypothetical protein [Chitinophagaceae bacterium]
MKTRGIVIAIILIIVIAAVYTKPDDRTIKIETINAIWGDVVPTPEKTPQFYEQFMNITTVNIYIDDWLLLKRIQYKMKQGKQTVGFAAFGKVMIRK